MYDTPPSDGFRPGASSSISSRRDAGTDPVAQLCDDGRFELTASSRGLVRMRPGVGWYLKAVMLDGRDVTDVPLSVPDGQN